MRVDKYLKSIKSMRFSELECDCCGATVYTTHPESGSFCHFCEAFTVTPKGSNVNPNANALREVHELMRTGNYDQAADTLAKVPITDDVHTLFGIGVTYGELSNAIYGAVDYTLPGFMDTNADRRNDEYNRNKNNSMHLLSKSKEMLFQLIYIARKQGNEILPAAQYLQFAALERLKRHVEAKSVLLHIQASSKDSLLSQYAAMAYEVSTGERTATQYIDRVSAVHEVNTLLYFAKNMVSVQQFGEAKRALTELNAMAYVPQAVSLLRKITSYEDEVRF